MTSFEAVTCPVCGGSLEDGYVVVGRALSWSATPARFTNLGAEWLLPPHLKFANLRARRCVACRLILFRYGDS